jgi:hypothetical protein
MLLLLLQSYLFLPLLDFANVVDFLRALATAFPMLEKAKTDAEQLVSRITAVEMVFRIDRLGRQKNTGFRIQFLSKSGTRAFIHEQSVMKVSKRSVPMCTTAHACPLTPTRTRA